jgi:glycosyltransferase involved in cell wall biosynthesis
MKLVINATEMGRRRGGNESYIAGLIEGLTHLQPLPLQVNLLTCRWDTAPELPPAFQQMNLGVYHRLPFLLWQQTLALKRLQADWYLANFFLPPFLPCHGVVVVHDLSFRAHPDYFPRPGAWYMRWLTGLAIRQARQVLTVSDFSRQELYHFYPEVDRSKVAVVSNGVGAEFQPLSEIAATQPDRAVLARYGINSPYILALGNIHPRKNLRRLLEAYIRLKEQRSSLPAMVWAGLPRWDSSELLAQAGAAGVMMTGFVAQPDLPVLYRQALMLVYPSLYEGFGLPPLEAMACGAPVITSNTTSLPEVVAEAALTINPRDVDELAAAMARLLDDPALRQQLQRAGFERAREFTWTRTAQRLLALLEPVS